MFQINNELFEIANNYQNFITKANLEGKKESLLLLTIILFLHLFITPIIIKGIKWYKKRKSKNKDNTEDEDIYNELMQSCYYLIAIALFTVGFFTSAVTIPRIKREAVTNAIEQYKTEHPDLKTLNEYGEDWVREFAKHHISNETTLSKTKAFKHPVFKPNIAEAPSIKYLQLHPAPEGDAPMVETRITTKSEVYTNKPDAKEKLSPNDVQLIKIEEVDGQTILTTHLNVDDVWIKVQIQENLLDNMIEGHSKFYYDQKQNKLIIGV